jgi:hypothetical protein
MGFMDKLQQTAKESFEKGKAKVEDVQADRAADKLLRDLGAWYYATRTGRDDGTAGEHIERLVGELQAHEAQYGELGKEAEPAPEAPPAGQVADPFAAPAAAPPAAPVADAPPAAPAPPAPPAPAAPVTDGPPPPPPA